MKRTMKALLALAAALACLPAAAGIPAAAAESPTNKTYETGDTLSAVASISKMFVTTAAMQLADEGMLDLDAPVTDYLPEFRMADSRYRNITVRMLMDHTSGLMGSCYSGMMLLDDRSTAAHDEMLLHLRSERLKAAPGAYASYCNDGFEVLELVIEAVSGESFTDYLEHHICRPLGMQQTGTQWNAFRTPEHVPVFLGRTEFTPDYCMLIGSGGILSTAPELCTFGSAFFTGNTILLSEQAKHAMRQRRSSDPCEDGSGLGWDFVGEADYDAAGVQIVSKGGDLTFQHGELLIAPDEEISVAVLSSGTDCGSSVDAQLAKALLDIALEEKGITVTHSRPEKKETLDAVPEQYLAYAGLYLGEAIFRLSFPEQRYMLLENLSDPTAEDRQFLCTTEDSFVEVLGSIGEGRAVQPEKQTLLRFAEKQGEVYLTYEAYSGDELMGYSHTSPSYMLQQAAPNAVSKDAQAAWSARDGKKYYLVNECWSGSLYAEMASLTLSVPQEAPGYVNSLAIRDATHAESVLHVPSSASRDQTDYEIRMQNGHELLCCKDIGLELLCEDAIPELPADLTAVQLTTGAASWYNIGSQTGRTVTLEIPEHAAVYVYNQRDRLTYSSFMKGCGNTIPLPAGGKIVFVGETGSTVGVAGSPR